VLRRLTLLLAAVFASVLGAAGQNVKALTTSASPADLRLSLNEPLDVLITVTNMGTTIAQIDLGQGRKSGLIVELKGLKISRTFNIPTHEGVSRRGRIPLSPREEYSQRLVLNEWVGALKPGTYDLTIVFENPAKFEDGTTISMNPLHLAVQVSARNEEALKRSCEMRLANLLAAPTYGDALDWAESLSYVQDPIAIRYLTRGFNSTYPVQKLLVDGVERIGSDDSIRALLQIANNPSYLDLWYMRRALTQLSGRTTDVDLQNRIQSMLDTGIH
jgi:hypothetical protein